MTTHGTDERCAIRLRLLLQALFQSPCLSGDEERVGHEFRDGTSCTLNVLGFPTSLDLAALRVTRWVVGGPHGAAVPAGTEADYFS
jgi:hypothetical protein